jgi:antirestriction protein ArdC
MSSKPNHPDSYQMVTDRIIAKLEAGTIPWKHFASSPLGAPKNLVSNKPYHGINYFLLGACSKYSSP